MTRTPALHVAITAAALAAIACSGSRPEQRAEARPTAAVRPAPPPGGVVPPGGAEICPMDVPDTTVAAADTADGEALTFTTKSGQVDELRRRVHALADMHNQHAAAAAPSPTGAGAGDDAHGDHAAHHGHHPRPPPSRATVEDVDGGARVLVTAVDPSQTDALRAAARMHAMHMQHHGCGEMH